MLRLDEEYSMTFGRPLGISGIGTCCWPQELTTDPIVLRFGDFMMQFTVLARQILSSDRLTDLRIDDFTDSLRGLLDTLPEMLQFHTSSDYPNNTLPHDSWPLRIMAAGTLSLTLIALVACPHEHGVGIYDVIHLVIPGCSSFMPSLSRFRYLHNNPRSPANLLTTCSLSL